ncbi:hypothetical protein AAHD62_22025 [Enterobacter hormaechei]
MSDTYRAVLEALRSENIGHYFHMASISIAEQFQEHSRPSAVFRPQLSQDGDAWLAIYGDLPTGVVGCGESPAEAMANFDMKWHEKTKSSQAA